MSSMRTRVQLFAWISLGMGLNSPVRANLFRKVIDSKSSRNRSPAAAFCHLAQTPSPASQLSFTAQPQPTPSTHLHTHPGLSTYQCFLCSVAE